MKEVMDLGFKDCKKLIFTSSKPEAIKKVQ